MKHSQSTIRHIRRRLRSTRLRDPLVWWRHLKLSANDVFLASYPRSGNTWMRFLLSEILTASSTEFDNVKHNIPDITIHSQGPRLLPNGGRLIRTHEKYRPEYKKAIYIVRDPRDVVISNYEVEWADDRFPGGGQEKFIESFVHGRATPHGSWQEHVDGWLHSPISHNGNLLLIRYEEMHADIEETLLQVLEFLGVPVHSETMRSAIAHNNLQHMRDKEDRARRKENVTVRGERGNGWGRHVRTGVVGGWRERLTGSQIQAIEDVAGPLMTALGYSTHFSLRQVVECLGLAIESSRESIT